MKKKVLIIMIIGIIALILLSVAIKWFVNKDLNVPFEISNITVVSSVDGEDKGKSEENFNLNILQNNDIYIDISNIDINEIDRILVDNFEIKKAPEKGNIHIYKPINENVMFKNSVEYKVEKELLFTDDKISIVNQDARIALRIANEYLVNYKSDEDSVVYDGSLLDKEGITQEEIEFKILFDVSIDLKFGRKFKTTIMLEVPNGDITKEGITTYELNNNEIIIKEY